MEHTTFFSSREQFAAFRTAFRNLANARSITPRDMMIYNIARSLPKERGFTPITNPIKLANGANPTHSLEQAISDLKWTIKRDPAYFHNRYEKSMSLDDIARLATLL